MKSIQLNCERMLLLPVCIVVNVGKIWGGKKCMRSGGELLQSKDLPRVQGCQLTACRSDKLHVANMY